MTRHVHPLARFAYENGLSLVLFGLFGVFLAGLAVTGFLQANEELESHGQQLISFAAYLQSGEFIEAVFENWESEFLQMGALVVLTIFLYQKGSADSKKLRGKEPEDTSSRFAIIRRHSMRQNIRTIKSFLYGNSLSIALFALFIASFVIHAFSGAAAHNQTALEHHEDTLTVWQYVGSSQFWFESFQNWQSEFLAVGVLLVLSIFLRQRGSPESKAVGDANTKTGE